MNLTVTWTKRFKKDYKQAMKRGQAIEELDQVIRILSKGKKLPEKYEDHQLTGNWHGHRECHIRPDWLLIYKISEKHLVLTLTRTGSHAELFAL